MAVISKDDVRSYLYKLQSKAVKDADKHFKESIATYIQSLCGKDDDLGRLLLNAKKCIADLNKIVLELAKAGYPINISPIEWDVLVQKSYGLSDWRLESQQDKLAPELIKAIQEALQLKCDVEAAYRSLNRIVDKSPNGSQAVKVLEDLGIPYKPAPTMPPTKGIELLKKQVTSND